MILIKAIGDEILKFPYNLEDLRIEYPNTSFPSNPSEEILNSLNIYIVNYYPYPEYDPRTQNLIHSTVPVKIDNQWSIKHVVTDKTAEEIALYQEAEIKDLRLKILNDIDAKTNELICYGWFFNGSHVRLLIEDQINFEGEFNLIKDLVENSAPEINFFPVQYKVWTNDDGSPVFLSLPTMNDLRTFLCGGKKYIRDCLADGWVIKNEVINMTLEQLQAFQDPRIEL